MIYDRNGKLIVFNTPQYNLTVTPKEVSGLDTLKFCQVFQITMDEFKDKMDKAKRYSYVQPTIFIKQLSNEDLAQVQDFLVDFNGFRIEARTT